MSQNNMMKLNGGGFSREPNVARPTAGFSLVEVVIALVILSVGLVATMTMFPIGIRAGRRATASTEVAMTAGRLLEEVRLAGFQGMDNDPPDVPLSGTVGRYTYQIGLSVPALEGVSVAKEVLRVDLTMSWEERSETRSETFVTYVSK